MPRLLPCLLLPLAFSSPSLPPASAQTRPATPSSTTSAADPAAALRPLVDRQRTLLEQADQRETPAELEDLRAAFQRLVFDYEAFLRRHPAFAPGYVSYALLLANPHLDERRQAAMHLLKANELDPNIPLVKNQLGNYLAEEGQPLDALNYYLAAVTLAPEEPLYHFQVGTLLTEARDAFLQSGAWSPSDLDTSMLKAFAQAAALSPHRLDFAYRHALAYYDLQTPLWSEALALWEALLPRAQGPIEEQTITLHLAKVLHLLGQTDQAQTRLASVTHPILATQRTHLQSEWDNPSPSPDPDPTPAPAPVPADPTP